MRGNENDLIISLGVIIVWNLIEEFRTPYEGYPTGALILGAGLAVGAVIVLAFVLTRIRTRAAAAAASEKGGS